MKLSTIFVSCMFASSSMFNIIASMSTNNVTALEPSESSVNGSSSSLSGFPEFRYRPPVPFEPIHSLAAAVATTAKSLVTINNTSKIQECAERLIKVVSSPTVLSGIQALVQFVQVLDPSLYERNPPRTLESLLDDVPPPNLGEHCGPWRHDPYGYFVRDCYPASATVPKPPSAPETIAQPDARGRPQNSAFKFNRTPYSSRHPLATRPKPSTKSLIAPSWNRPPIAVLPTEKRIFRTRGSAVKLQKIYY